MHINIMDACIYESYKYYSTQMVIFTTATIMDQPAAKRVRISVEEVLLDLEDDDDEPMFPGSDDEFKDLVCDEK